MFCEIFKTCKKAPFRWLRKWLPGRLGMERGSINLLLNVLVIEETSNINVRRAQLKFVLAHNPSPPPLPPCHLSLFYVKLAWLDSLTQGSSYFTTSSLPAETSDLRGFLF